MVGEHIRTRRDGRWTHAIDCGDATVIHLAKNGDGAPRIQRTYRPEFVAGAEAVEVVQHRERTFAAKEIVARAYSRISLGGLASMFRDSEAFAEWCATGRLPPAPENVALAVSSRAPARAAPQPRPKPTTARAAATAKPKARATSGAKRAPSRAGSKGKARATAIRKAAPKRAARKASAPSRKNAARRGAKRGRR